MKQSNDLVDDRAIVLTDTSILTLAIRRSCTNLQNLSHLNPRLSPEEPDAPDPTHPTLHQVISSKPIEGYLD